MQRKRWQVLHVMTNHEKRIAAQLDARSLEHYLPIYVERSRWTDRTVRLERPLFAGYVFARFALEKRHAVIGIPGVFRLLGNTVSEIEIARIRDGLASGCLLRPHLPVTLGTPVRVLRGVFEGAQGVVTEFRQQCKVVMALSATGQSFSLELAHDDIEILSKPVAIQTADGPGQSAQYQSQRCLR